MPLPAGNDSTLCSTFDSIAERARRGGQIQHDKGWRPDALAVTVVYLGMQNQMTDQMFR